MSDVWAPGIGRWFRDRTLPRVTARLCAAALLLNLFAPILWAVAAPEGAPMACHDAGSADRSTLPGDPAKPAADYAPHCPLCVLFGGTAWAPPATPASVLADLPRHDAATVLRGDALPGPLPATLRPSPRAPPFSA
jgi:hypothetical protein